MDILLVVQILALVIAAVTAGVSVWVWWVIRQHEAEERRAEQLVKGIRK